MTLTVTAPTACTCTGSSEPNIERLSRGEAQALATIATRLDRRPRPTRNPAEQKARLLETIQHLGCVQLDTISVVSRSHETVLWSRLGAYDPALLAVLHAQEGLLTEYWAHAAAIIPTEWFPYFRHAMTDWYREKYEQPGTWAARNIETIEAVYERIRENGATAARLFERPNGPKPEAWTWYGGKPARQALDHLWSRGDIMVTRRESGFQRVYDLTERVVPASLLEHLPDDAERRRHFTSNALRALGVATPRWVADYFRSWARPHNSPKASLLGLQELAAEGLAVPVEVEGLNEPAFLDVALLPRLANLRAGRGKPTLTTLLSPFDNLVWHRGRDEALWDFHYRIEVYTPAPKRIYGYYSLPILHRGKLVGRLDAVVDRKQRTLTVRSVHLEPKVKPSESLAVAVAGALWDFAGFLNADEVFLLQANPESFAPVLGDALQRPSR